MELGVFAYIKNPEGSVLLVKDASRQELWTLPGGGPEFKELIPGTLVREVKEETSCDIIVQGLLGIFSQQKTPGIIILMEALIVGGVPTPDGKETSECKFFSLEELLAVRDEVKPAQLSMVYQVSKATSFPLYNAFPAPEALG